MLTVQLWEEFLPDGNKILLSCAGLLLQLQLVLEVSIYNFERKSVFRALQDSVLEKEVPNMQRLKVETFFKVKVLPFSTVFIFTTSKKLFPFEKVVYPFEDLLLYATYQVGKKDMTNKRTFVASIHFH